MSCHKMPHSVVSGSRREEAAWSRADPRGCPGFSPNSRRHSGNRRFGEGRIRRRPQSEGKSFYSPLLCHSETLCPRFSPLPLFYFVFFNLLLFLSFNLILSSIPLFSFSLFFFSVVHFLFVLDPRVFPCKLSSRKYCDDTIEL